MKITNRKRVLVTGGTGFLGSHLCERLLLEGNEVLCVDNFYSSTKDNIVHLMANQHFELMRHDICNPLHAEVDEIYNLACPASPVHYQRDPIQTVKTSFLGAMNMLDLAKRAFIIIYILWICKKDKIKFLHFCILLGSISFIVICPAFYDKYMRYGSNLFEYFLNPVSSSEESLKYFIETARQYKESRFIFPIYLIIPDSFGKVSTILGIGVFLAVIPLFINNVVTNFLRTLIAINIFVLVLVSMPSSRFF